MMRTTSFNNLSTRSIKLGIEPWGFACEVSPDEKVEIAYELEDEMELVFAVVNDNVAVISISSSRLIVTSKGVLLFDIG